MLKLSKKLKQISVLFFILMLVFSFPQTAFAEETTGSIRLSYKIEGAEFNLYKLTNTSPKGNISLADEFLKYSIDFESENAASTLASYIKSDNIQPFATAITDENFVASFNNLPKGNYLITGSEKEFNGVKYIPLPVMVALPNLTDDTMVWDLHINGKYETVVSDDKRAFSVLKIWKDQDDQSSRPKEISVSLLKNGQVFDTTMLNADNSWKFKWSNLDPDGEWSVIENNVPDGYEVNIQKDGNSFIITNTYKKVDSPNNVNPTTPVTPQLPQTGQLWWPACTFLLLGICFIGIGLIRRRKNVKNEI